MRNIYKTPDLTVAMPAASRWCKAFGDAPQAVTATATGAGHTLRIPFTVARGVAVLSYKPMK